MTKTEHYLEVAKECGACIRKFEFPSGGYERIEMSPEELDAYTIRICAEKDAEIANFKVALKTAQDLINEKNRKLSAANAAIAMKDSILKDLFNSNSEMYSASPEGREYLAKIQDALSVSPESIAAWEAGKQAKWNEESNSLIGQLEIEVLSLQRQVAMLHNTLASVEVVGMNYEESSNIYFTCPECEFNKAPTSQMVKHAKDCMIQNALSNTEATAEAYDKQHAAKVLEEAASQFEEEDEQFRIGENMQHTYATRLRRKAAELRTANEKENG